MFEVGRYFRVKIWENGKDGGKIADYAPAQVIEVSLPLVKLKASAIAGGDETILNTASLAFVSAAIVE